MAQLAQLVEDVVGQRFDITDRALTIGRHAANAVQIDEQAVSARHAAVLMECNSHFKDHKEYYLEDLDSTNGTYVNGRRVAGRVRLHHNDLIRMAWSQFKFLDIQEVEFEKTVQMISEM